MTFACLAVTIFTIVAVSFCQNPANERRTGGNGST